MNELQEEILNLEKFLLNPNDKSKLESIILNGFIEFGASGKQYNKQQIIESVLNRDIKYNILEFNIKELSVDAILVTYIIEINNQKSRLSSFLCCNYA